MWTGQTQRGFKSMLYAGGIIAVNYWFDFSHFDWVPIFSYFTLVIYLAIEAAMLAARWRAGQDVGEDNRPIWESLTSRIASSSG